MSIKQEILAALKVAGDPVTANELHHGWKIGEDKQQVFVTLSNMKKAGEVIRTEIPNPELKTKPGAQKTIFAYSLPQPAAVPPEKQDAAEERMDVIGQNGNEGLHYDQPDLVPERTQTFKPMVMTTNPAPTASECEQCHKLEKMESDVAFLLQRCEDHPLRKVFDLAIHQLTKGKGERHGGEKVPFLNQQWVTLADDFGTGFLFGQSSKKLREAMGKVGEARQRELLGALNYLAMGVLYEMAIPVTTKKEIN